MFHRIWECDCDAAMEARASIAPQHLIDEALARGPSCAAFVRGLGPDLGECMDPQIPDGGVRYCKDGREISDREQWTLHGDVFYDGSCIQRSAPGLSRATWAVVQMSSDNKAVVTVSGPVWNSLPQTAQAAEHCARTAAVELLTGPARLFGDSRNIVKDAQRPLVEACHHSRMHAAASRLAGLSVRRSSARICGSRRTANLRRRPTTGTNSLPSATGTRTLRPLRPKDDLVTPTRPAGELATRSKRKCK